MNIKELSAKKINELLLIAKDYNIEGASGMRKQDLIYALLQAETEKNQQAEKNGLISGEGVLEILPDQYGFLRSLEAN